MCTEMTIVRVRTADLVPVMLRIDLYVKWVRQGRGAASVPCYQLRETNLKLWKSHEEEVFWGTVDRCGSRQDRTLSLFLPLLLAVSPQDWRSPSFMPTTTNLGILPHYDGVLSWQERRCPKETFLELSWWQPGPQDHTSIRAAQLYIPLALYFKPKVHVEIPRSGCSLGLFFPLPNMVTCNESPSSAFHCYFVSLLGSLRTSEWFWLVRALPPRLWP